MAFTNIRTDEQVKHAATFNPGDFIHMLPEILAKRSEIFWVEDFRSRYGEGPYMIVNCESDEWGGSKLLLTATNSIEPLAYTPGARPDDKRDWVYGYFFRRDEFLNHLHRALVTEAADV